MKIEVQKNCVLHVLFLAIFLISSAQGQNMGPRVLGGDERGIPNYVEIREGIFSGGQPTADGLNELARDKVRTVINLRPYDEKGAWDESEKASGLGMNYFSLPLTPATFTMEKVHEFSCIVKDRSNYPLFVHCKSGNRAAGLWFLYRVLYEDVTEAQAIQEARAIGLEPSLELVVLEFLRNNRDEPPVTICEN